jgi:D-beta-D-heptose 7-phosphate kinase/D-beta-D-heptose 1-phosphate adenosyltransferase
VESDAASGAVPAKAGRLLTESRLPPPIFLTTKARQVFDVSGAGDTLVAVFSAAKQAGLSTGLAGELANIASGVVVSQVGTVPITLAALTEEINQLGL